MTKTPQLSPKHNRLVALAIFLFVFVVLLITDKHISITWDEPAYMTAAESYADWFGELVQNPGYALSAEGIETYWTANHEHPPLDKMPRVFFHAHLSALDLAAAAMITAVTVPLTLFILFFIGVGRVLRRKVMSVRAAAYHIAGYELHHTNSIHENYLANAN